MPFLMVIRYAIFGRIEAIVLILALKIGWQPIVRKLAIDVEVSPTALQQLI